ncbi:golgin subfamily A member 6-like protein 22 [Watersipora subatra]|uniref:golgin subfamily A member 6-like protein 22 n=1 Tax=Watersipora subatra TaxID=2589382 RepID=UPI00355BA8B3
MNAARGKSATNKVNSIGVRNVKAKFENGMKCQRAPSPAPVSMAMKNTGNQKKGISSSTISSYKERFELFTAPKTDATPKPVMRRASSEEIVGKSQSLERTKSNSSAEGHWFQARTKIYEQLSKKRALSTPGLENLAGEKLPVEKLENKPHKRKVEERGEIATISERISKYKSDVETKKTISEKLNDPSSKPTVHISDIKSSFKTKEEILESVPKPAVTTEKPKGLADKVEGSSTDKNTKKLGVYKSETVRDTNGNSNNKIMPSKTDDGDSISRDQEGTANKSIKIHEGIQKVIITDVTDMSTARTFMEELIAAIDNEQHVPMKQLIDLFEKMKRENGEMKNSIEHLKSKLNKEDLDSLSISLRQQLDAATAELESAKEQMKELASYREAVKESEERCEELEELNHQYLEDIEELKLVMNEMRDQFHDDEVHETIILQQRLDDMARSLRIIHFRLKKADAKLQETEREKETLLEEIKLLQRGTFTDEEIRRMQSLEGDLQTAKEISVELHARLQKSEERREKVEREANQLRDEIAANDLENERLRNNILHLREQIRQGDNEGVLSPAVKISRQGSSVDMDTLKNNLEASIERENDIKEQLSFAEQDAKMLRKRLRDIEHENEALTKQLKKLTNPTSRKGKDLETSEHIQTEVIQLENAQLRRNNDKLHQDIDNLQSQIKSLQQKLTLVQDEEKEGPLSISKNSLYYETKFEKMMQEIRDLREQLQEKDADFKRLREETTGKSRRDQFRRAITIDCDSVDIKNQLDIALQEASQLKRKLEEVERRNEELVNQGRDDDRCQDNTKNIYADSNLLAARSETASCLAEANGENDRKLNSGNSKSAYEQNQGKKSIPDIGELARKLQESEEKVVFYESQLLALRRDMQTMEKNLHDDINSLTMKNSILRQLLEVISEHEGDEKYGGGEAQHPHHSRQANFRQTADRDKTDSTMESESAIANSDLGSDSVIAKHISRLPHDIQSHFRKKISYLENQLKEERERSKTAERLLQQVKKSTSHSTDKMIRHPS